MPVLVQRKVGRSWDSDEVMALDMGYTGPFGISYWKNMHESKGLQAGVTTYGCEACSGCGENR